ncbi:MAG: hypothetical protein F6K54_16440 [Okeania sp. SIO3B5]|uniref:hypothetical protein n=1 Tax=Okeania sp. SIO3B5 TaxID=2607811 RepID=UPI00140087C7|nr:hypothetical protein [Okeania sp. SIO3B5]NEO54530.1 hypothetical protein [Okeania sp. SIO3B5]
MILVEAGSKQPPRSELRYQFITFCEVLYQFYEAVVGLAVSCLQVSSKSQAIASGLASENVNVLVLSWEKK